MYEIGEDLDSAMFALTEEIEDESVSKIGDARVIYDGYTDRFWMVAAELGYATDYAGRLHIAVSKSGVPDYASTASWYKWSEGAGTGHEALDLTSDAAMPGDYMSPNTAPDRPSIAVDETYLYIAVREADPGSTPNDDRTLMMVLVKADLLNGEAWDADDIQASQLIDNVTGHPWGHELAVDKDIEDDDTFKVYMVCQPTYPNAGTVYESIRFGVFYKSGGSWIYDFENLDLTLLSRDYKGADSDAPGGSSDTNYIPPSLFWSCATRRLDGENRMVWAVHHVRANNGSTYSRLQWYQIDPHAFPSGTPTLELVTRYTDPDNAWLHDPSIGVNIYGDLAITYTRSVGATGYPEFWVRVDPHDAAATSSQVRTGPSQYYSENGWLDFSGTDSDPASDCDFWGHSITVFDDEDVSPSAQWQSGVAKYSILDCGERPALRHDLNLDGVTDASDLQTFQEASQWRDSAADRNADSAIDVFDFLEILDEVRSGSN